jgi:putative lipoprotein
VTVTLLAACGSEPPAVPADRPAVDPWEDARGRGIEFRALGQEPGWFLEIDEGRSMHLVYDYMEREATTSAPTVAMEGTTTVYRGSTGAQSLTVTVDDRECQDIMSGFEFPNTVTVDIDGRILHGCGRRLAGDE